MSTLEIKIGNMRIGADNPLAFIAGPCVIEDEISTIKAAEKLKGYAEQLNIPLIFKSSYYKSNRTSVNSFSGPGIDVGLKVLNKVKEATGLPVISDIHSADEAEKAATVLDILQIPAFLCRQTDIVLSAAKTGKPVNIKKGQFLAPWDVKNIIEKAVSTGNNKLMITERGTSFGYNNLVADMRSIPIIRGFGFPVVYDATHSIQLPGGMGISSGGQREFIEPLARSAVSAGCDLIFMEVHEDPDSAPCDGPSMMKMESFPTVAKRLSQLNDLVKSW